MRRATRRADWRADCRGCGVHGVWVAIAVVIAVALLGLAPPAVPADAVPVEASAVEPVDCALAGLDDRCERWAAVYDDDELYDNSLIPAEEPSAGDDLHGMVVSPTGTTVFTLGESCLYATPVLCRWGIVAHRAATGDELWAAQLELVPQRERAIVLTDIAVSADGRRVYVTGKRTVWRRGGDGDPLLNTAVLLIAYDAATGRRLWRTTFTASPVGHRRGDPHNLHAGDGGVAVTASPTDGRVYVTGYSDHRDSYYNVLVLTYDGATGTRLWASTYNHAPSAGSPAALYPEDKALPQLVAVSPDGTTLYLGGVSCDPEWSAQSSPGASPGSSAGPCAYLLLVYQAHDPGNPVGDGRRRWVRRVGTGSADQAPTLLELAADGSRLYVTGHGLDPQHPDSDVTAAYSTGGGQRLWTVDHPAGRPVSMAVSPTGDTVFTTGPSSGTGYGTGYGTVAIDAVTGEPAWTATYGPPGTEHVAAAMGVSPDGARVYVTGTRRHAMDNTIEGEYDGARDGATGRQVTVSYDTATGGQLWVAVYNRPLDTESGQHLVVGVDGTVLTAGTLNGPATSKDTAFNGLRPGLVTENVADWGVQAYAYTSG